MKEGMPWSVGIVALSLGASLGFTPVEAGVEAVPLRFAESVPDNYRASLDAGYRAGAQRGLDATNDADPAAAGMSITGVVSVLDGDVMIVLEVRDAASGRLVAESSDRCVLCGVAEARDRIESRTAAIVQKATTRAPARIVVKTRPAGAEVLVDGVSRGRAPLELEVPPGPHVLEVRTPNHTPQRIDVIGVQGVAETIELSLRRLPEPAPTTLPSAPPRTEPLWPTGWALLGAGLAGVGAGAGLLAVNGRAYPSPCTDAERDVDGDCPRVFTTTPIGAAFLASGAALVVTGAVLTAVGAKRRRRSKLQAGPIALGVRF